MSLMRCLKHQFGTGCLPKTQILKDKLCFFYSCRAYSNSQYILLCWNIVFLYESIYIIKETKKQNKKVSKQLQEQSSSKVHLSIQTD